MIVEFDAFGRKLYIFIAHISAIVTSAPGKGSQIFIDDSDEPFSVTADVETALRKVRELMAAAPKER